MVQREHTVRRLSKTGAPLLDATWPAVVAITKRGSGVIGPWECDSLAGMRVIAAMIAVFAGIALSGCKDAPGADGRYAMHDGGNRHGSP